jgi:serine/threonine-protein kinase
MVFGTPEYMSPEQARGDKPDTRVDIYALGCILFEMITGDVPFHADNFMGVLTKHLFEPAPRLLDRCDRTDYPSGLQAVIDEAMQKDRQHRFSTMNELSVALDTLATIPPSGPARVAPSITDRTMTPPPPAPERSPSSLELEPTRAAPTVPPVPAITLETETQPKSRRGWWAALGLVLLGGAGAGGWYLHGRAPADEPEKVTPVAAPEPLPAAKPAPPPEPTSPPPEPTPPPPADPVEVVVEEPPPPVVENKKPQKPDRRRKRPKTTHTAGAPPIAAPPPEQAKPTPTPVEGGTTIRPKSGLKDPFKKK